MSEPAPLPQPDDLFANRYRIANLLGKGGFGAVYQARDTSLERDVAIKVLAREVDAQLLARFLQEARASASLASEHVATVYEVGSTGDGPYIVMELLRGCDLQDELDDRARLPVPEAVDHVLQAALGIAHAHARGIIHRDLKPRNLFLADRADGTRVIKILDFGIAKSTATDLTQTGATLGTPQYMAPEQLRTARTVDARTDVWALGVVLYELVTGKGIFDGETATQLAVSIVIDPHVRLRERDPSLSPDLEAVIDRCLAKEPAARYPDVHQLASALAPFASEAGRVLIPRIERALGDRASRPVVKSDATANTIAATPLSTDPTIEAPPRATATRRDHAVDPEGPTIATPPERPAAIRDASSDPPREVTAARPHRATIVLGVLAAAAIVIALVLWQRGAPAGAGRVSPDARALSPDAATTPDAALTSIPTAPDAPAPVADAATEPPQDAAPARPDAAAGPPRPTRPSAKEIAAIQYVCVIEALATPRFLVSHNDGPAETQCGRLADLGCAVITSRCRSIPVTDEERQRCRDFLDKLKRDGICR